MKIVIIGSGNVAAVLGRKFVAAGHSILQVVGRNGKAASELAYEWKTTSANYLSAVNLSADVYIIAVSDHAIAEVIRELRLPGKVVAHTAAAESMDILKKVSPHHGVFYPLQSLRKERNDLPPIPIFFEGSDEKAKEYLGALAFSIQPKTVVEVEGDALLKMHVAGVFVNNFTNHLYTLAEQYCNEEGLDFSQLYPLILETATRLKDISPRQAQTGPAARADQATIDKHLALLEKKPHLKKVYELMTASIQSLR